MRLASSAPTRVDLAGGTLDIWPLYLFHRDAQTINAALTLRAHCRLTRRADDRIVVRSADTGAHLDTNDVADVTADGSLALIGYLLRFFDVRGIELETWSDSPVGAGLAGSSALNVALCTALARWCGRELSDRELLDVAMNVEAQAIRVPTGAQDFRPAFYGGISAVELRVDGVHTVPLGADAEELSRRLLVAYTGASRNSGINNWDITKRHIDGDARIVELFDRVAAIASAMRRALEARAWHDVGRLIAEEWALRKQLAPGVTTAAIDRLIACALEAGALAAKLCGAGGGGCLLCFADPRNVAAVGDALAREGARILPCAIDRTGVSLAE